MVTRVNKQDAPISSNIFTFNEILFQQYYELRFTPHDKVSGWKFMWLFFFMFLIGFIFEFFVIDLFEVSGPSIFGVTEEPARDNRFTLALYLAAYCLIAFLGIIYGFRVWRGMRRPRWGNPRWEARTNATFRRLADGPTTRPMHPCTWTSVSLASFMPTAWLGSLTTDQPAFHDMLPGLYPTIKIIDNRLSEGPPLRQAPFASRFYADRVEKGRVGENSESFLYEEIYDMVEDARYPDLAILRMKKDANEVVVHKDAFEGATWDEVRETIRESKGEITLREALFGKKKEGS